MTGYGEAKGECGGIDISIELKSVNSRYLDCNVKLPRVYIAAEEPIKSVVQRHISRGKVDVFVTLDMAREDDAVIRVNKPLARAYLEALRELSGEFGLPEVVDAVTLASYPDVLRAEKRETDSEALYAAILAVLEVALTRFDTMREQEGARLGADIEVRLAAIEKLAARAEERSPETVAEYRERLEARIRELLQDKTVSDARVLTEVAIFADKVAVDEELVRLASHIAQTRLFLDSAEPIGRRLDFLVQELNREVNTLGTKGNDSEMTLLAVDIKAEIEKIREQAQNIE
jgi:uncharacterized protein (TIGR00255 family)